MKIIINDDVYQKVMYWVHKSDYEVSGLGKVLVEGGTIRVIEAMLLPQENTAASTDIAPEAVCKAMYDLRNTEGELKWWWHSHVNMNVFWSGTDSETIEAISAGGWFSATVFNKSAERLSAYAQVAPIPLFLNEVDTTVFRSLDGALTGEWDRAYEENVTNFKLKLTKAQKRKMKEEGFDDEEDYFRHWHKLETGEGSHIFEPGVGEVDDDIALADLAGTSWANEMTEVQNHLREMGEADEIDIERWSKRIKASRERNRKMT